MGKVITYSAQRVSALGLSKTTPNIQNITSYLFDEYLKAIQDTSIPIVLPQNPLLFYPGCGPDILSPLMLLQRFSPIPKEVTLYFIDITNYKKVIQTVLSDCNISFEKHHDHLSFFFYETLCHLYYYTGNISKEFNNIPPIDIYFEKAFRIMRDEIFEYEKSIYEKIKNNGVLISDTGFRNFNLKKIQVPNNLSSYGEMIVATKSES